jgi:hypothetical protein
MMIPTTDCSCSTDPTWLDWLASSLATTITGGIGVALYMGKLELFLKKIH